MKSTAGPDTSKYMANPTVKEPDYSADPRVFEHEFWMESLGFDKSTVRVCHQGNIDYIANSGIQASDIDTVCAQLRPRSMYATPIDYEKIQPNFCYMPIQRVIDTLTHTTQNMVLQ